MHRARGAIQTCEMHTFKRVPDGMALLASVPAAAGPLSFAKLHPTSRTASMANVKNRVCILKLQAAACWEGPQQQR